MYDIATQIDLLYSKDNMQAHQAFKCLEQTSKECEAVYPYIKTFIDMLSHSNSYIRNRGLILIAANAKWDKDFQIDKAINLYLQHITDIKPITSRQCIQSLPLLAQHKPNLRTHIIQALLNANISIYTDSMRHLIGKDIQMALSLLQSDNKYNIKK